MNTELIIDTNDRLTVRSTVDYVEVGSADVIKISQLDSTEVGANDSLIVTPYQSATSIDYKIPQSVTQGILDVAAIREDLLLKLADLDLAINYAKAYKDEVEESVRTQVFSEMDVRYLSNSSSNTATTDFIKAQVLATDLSNMVVVTSTDTNGEVTSTATLGELKDRYLEVGNSLSGFTSQLNANTTASSAAVTATQVLTAKVDDVEATVSSGEYVAVGEYTQYTTGLPVTGQWRGSAGSYEQWRVDSWVNITGAQHARYLKQLSIAGAKSLSTVGDAIVGWEYTNGGAGDNEFKIKADKFYLEAAGSSTKQSAYVPFSVDATSGEINFNGKVTFGSANINGLPTHTSGVIASRPSSPTVGSTYTATDEYDAIYTYTNTGWIQNGIVAGALNTELARNTTVIDGGRITTGTISAQQIDADAINGKNINGSYIYGSYIEGAIIKASFIDLSSTVTLTNWQYFNANNVPSEYISNFAYNNDGSIVEDSLGYVRLPGNTRVSIAGHYQDERYSGSKSFGANVTKSLSPCKIEYYSYDDYTVNTLQRSITNSPTITMSESGSPMSISASCGANYNSWTYCDVSFSINGDNYIAHSQFLFHGTLSDPIRSTKYSLSKNGALVDSKEYNSVPGYSTIFPNITISTFIGNIEVPIVVSHLGMSCSIPAQNSSFVCSNYSGTNGKIFELVSATVIGYDISAYINVKPMVVT